MRLSDISRAGVFFLPELVHTYSEVVSFARHS